MSRSFLFFHMPKLRCKPFVPCKIIYPAIKRIPSPFCFCAINQISLSLQNLSQSGWHHQESLQKIGGYRYTRKNARLISAAFQNRNYLRQGKTHDIRDNPLSTPVTNYDPRWIQFRVLRWHSCFVQLRLKNIGNFLYMLWLISVKAVIR